MLAGAHAGLAIGELNAQPRVPLACFCSIAYIKMPDCVLVKAINLVSLSFASNITLLLHRFVCGASELRHVNIVVWFFARLK